LSEKRETFYPKTSISHVFLDYLLAFAIIHNVVFFTLTYYTVEDVPKEKIENFQEKKTKDKEDEE